MGLTNISTTNETTRRALQQPSQRYTGPYEIGERIGNRYLVVDYIGSGPMAAVYRVRDEQRSGSFVLKGDFRRVAAR